MITIRAMRAAGMSADQIVRLLEAAENEKLLHRREQNRIYKRNQRSGQQKRADNADMKNAEQNQRSGQQVSADMMTSAYIEESLSSSSTQSKKKERKKVSIPENWLPNEKGLALARQVGFDDQRIKLEIHRFEDYAHQHNRQYADWQAAWRNWVTSPLQKQERKRGSGNGLMEALDRAIDRASGEDFGRPNPIRDVTPGRAEPSKTPPALLAPRKPT